MDSIGATGPLAWGATAFFAAALAVLHVVIDPAGFDVSLLPRLVALLAGLLVIIGGVAAAVWLRPAPRLDVAGLWEPTVIWLAVYVAVVWTSLAWAFNPTAGLADAFKSLGMVVVTCLACLLLPALPRWREFLPAAAACGMLLLVAIGVAEISAARGALPPGALLPGRGFMESHVTARQSNVNLFANLLVLLLPWCLWGLAAPRGFARTVSRLAAASGMAMILLVQSRSAYLGLVAGAVAALVAAVSAADRLGLSRRWRRGAMAAAVGVAGFVAGFVLLAPDEVGLARRLRSIVVDPPAAPGVAFRDGGRREIWRTTGRMIADRPLTGVGAGNFGIVLQAYYDERVDLSRMHHNWANPHNDFLWVWAEKGLVGIAAYVAWLAAAAVAAVRVVRRAADRRDRWLGVCGLALLAAFVTMSCFDFPLERVSQPVVIAVTCGVLADVARRSRPGGVPAAGAKAGQPSGSLPATAWFAAATLVAVAGLAAGVAWTAGAVAQDRWLAQVEYARRDDRWDEMLAAARSAAWPWRTIDAHLAPVALHEGHALMMLDRPDEALASLERALDHNPNRLDLLTRLGVLYARAGRYGEAEICLREVVRRYPQDVSGYVNLAACLVDAGRAAEAVALLEAIPSDMRSTLIEQALQQAREARAEAVAPAG